MGVAVMGVGGEGADGTSAPPTSSLLVLVADTASLRWSVVRWQGQAGLWWHILPRGYKHVPNGMRVIKRAGAL